MPVFYGFCDSLMREAELRSCITQVVTAVEGAGSDILASICDQSSTNRAIIKKLVDESNAQCTNQRSTFLVGISQIIPIMDPSHIIKGTRNNLLTKYLEKDYNANRRSSQPNSKKSKIGEGTDMTTVDRERKLVRWSVIEEAYKIDQMTNGFEPQMKKLTYKHIYGDSKRKMRVKYAVQVLSNTVAKCIESLAGRSLHDSLRISNNHQIHRIVIHN
ncbi:uncharacterized protein LOC107045168 [Diachasma alloeum]|uniref:uncharacterized protein LOC107045168 n=1 Tax=Diachasma alloeum TaxID=454923 RepID=UPI0007382EB1|nr:uncharacterized protein LOC107045168 [Diachasma alloeum]